MNKSWEAFTLKIPIRASKDKIYSAWSTSQGLESWFLSNAEFSPDVGSIRSKEMHIEPNDLYTWEWHGFPNYTEHGVVRETNHKDYLKFSFQTSTNVSIEVSDSYRMRLTLSMIHMQITMYSVVLVGLSTLPISSQF